MSATALPVRRARYPRSAFSIEVKLLASTTYSHDLILDTKLHYVAG